MCSVRSYQVVHKSLSSTAAAVGLKRRWQFSIVDL